MKRIFIFSLCGRNTHETSFNRLISFAQNLTSHYEVFFFYGSTDDSNAINKKRNFFEIPLLFENGIAQKIHKKLKSKNIFVAKFFFILYYIFTRKEIYEFQDEAIKFLKNKEVMPNENDIVFVTFPTLAIQNLGYKLKKKYKTSLVLEYRDPGVFGYKQLFENAWMQKARKLFLKKQEVRNIENADLIVTVSDSLKNFFPQKYHQKIHVIKNGYNKNLLDLSNIKNLENRFILVYLGSVYHGQFEDLSLFSALKKFVEENNISPDKFMIKFIGTNDKKLVKKVIDNYGLAKYTFILGKIPIDQVYQEMYDASMFFHLKYGNRSQIITSKQYDYLAFQKPILLPASDYGDIAKSIMKYKAGFICENENEILEVLRHVVKNHLNGKPFTVSRTDEELYDLSRKAQEDKLIALIDKL